MPARQTIQRELIINELRSMANHPTADEVYAFDASRQTKRVSANVSGLGSTAAIRLNDNLLNRTSLPEIRAVMAHELAHYVLNHGPKMLMQFGLLILFGLLFCHWAMRLLFARYGAHWGMQSVDDVASLPLLTAVFSVATMLLGLPIPVAVPVLGSLGLAVVLWFLPNNELRDQARKAREEFSYALGAFVEMVALELGVLERGQGGQGLVLVDSGVDRA